MRLRECCRSITARAEKVQLAPGALALARYPLQIRDNFHSGVAMSLGRSFSIFSTSLVLGALVASFLFRPRSTRSSRRRTARITILSVPPNCSRSGLGREARPARSAEVNFDLDIVLAHRGRRRRQQRPDHSGNRSESLRPCRGQPPGWPNVDHRCLHYDEAGCQFPRAWRNRQTHRT